MVRARRARGGTTHAVAAPHPRRRLGLICGSLRTSSRSSARCRRWTSSPSWRHRCAPTPRRWPPSMVARSRHRPSVRSPDGLTHSDRMSDFTTTTTVPSFGAVHLDVRNLAPRSRSGRAPLARRVGRGRRRSATRHERRYAPHRAASRPTGPVRGGFAGSSIWHCTSRAKWRLVEHSSGSSRGRESPSATDHSVAKSLYLSDPDGIGLELAFETPERVSSFTWDPGARHPTLLARTVRP